MLIYIYTAKCYHVLRNRSLKITDEVNNIRVKKVYTYIKVKEAKQHEAATCTDIDWYVPVKCILYSRYLCNILENILTRETPMADCA